MKKILKTSLTIITCFLTLASFGQKQVHLLHGMGGAADSFGTLNEKLESCPGLNTTYGTYTSNNGLEAYKADLIPVLESVNAGSEDIAICHSFGGLVARSLDQDNANYFGGYITIGTSHHGAYLANAAENGHLQNFLENACYEMVNDPIDAFNDALSNSPFIILTNLISFFLDKASEKFCDGIFDKALDKFSQFSGPNQNSIKDLQVGSVGSSLAPASLPAIGINAIAESPIHWNLVADFSGMDIPGAMQELEDNYYGLALQCQALASMSRPRWFNPLSYFNGGLSSGLLNTADELEEGAQWLANSEDGFNELIGAGFEGTWVTIQIEIPSGQPCMSDGECGINEECIDQVCTNVSNFPCEQGSDGTTYFTQSVFIPGPDLPSDGVVLLESQQLPGAIVNLEPIQDVSHFAEPANDRIHKEISKLLDPANSWDQVFNIPNCNF